MGDPQCSAGSARLPASEHKSTLKVFYVLLILGWTMVMAVSLWYTTSRLEEHALDSARIQARTAIEKDVVYRQWNSQHGGVYVPVIPGKFEPNPYLPEKGRDITDQDGNAYTKINPAYMTRLVHELGVLQSGAIGHITSNKPIRKGNEPDGWESESLTKLEQRLTDEVSAVTTLNGVEYLRLIRGLNTDKSCLSCHAQQGYVEGDVRGGISVAVPLAPFFGAASASRRALLIAHLGIWLLGFLGISFGIRQISRGIAKQTKAEHDLRQLAAELEQRVKERTADLKMRQQELQGFVNNVQAGVYIKSLEDVFLMANANFASIIKAGPGNLVGRRARDVLSPEIMKIVSDVEEEVLRCGLPQEGLLDFSNGETRRYYFLCFPLFEDQQVVNLGGLLVDMSERYRAEQAMREAKEAAEQASRAKTDFLANMSHEIRTPLNGVIGMGDLLMRTKLTEDQASMVAAIKSSGESLLMVLNDVLDISKIEAGKMYLEHIPFALRDTLFDAIKGLAPTAFSKKLELLLQISPSVPEYVAGDPVRVRQIVLNLVNNALKFTESGEVRVTVTPAGRRNHFVRLRFSVSDTGIGIPIDKQAAVFQAFEQVDRSTTRKYGGTGLGLAICSRLLEMMNSKLELQSREGEGSCFSFELELPEESGPIARHRMDQAIPTPEELRNLHILILDDNATNRQILSETLLLNGVRVAEAANADQALALAQEAVAQDKPFDLIISDMLMPGKDGLDFLHMLRAEAALETVPVILLTSANLPLEMQGNVGKPGFFEAALDKPIRPETMLRAIGYALNLGNPDESQLHGRLEKTQQQPGLKILLAEDVELNQLVAGRMLAELGHSVKVACNGKEALEAVLWEKYDLIFMDIQMPVLDGMQATQAIRDLEAKGVLQDRVPIIAMTANAFKDDREKYLSMDMDGYVSKPIVLEDLRKVIEETMGFARPGPAAGSAAEGKARTGDDAGRPPTAGDQPGNPADETTALDWEQIKKTFSDKRDLVIQCMNVYLQDAPKLLRSIREAMDKRDNDALIRNAHALKGITGYFTLGRPYELCLKLEYLGRGGGLPAEEEVGKDKYQLLLAETEQLLKEMTVFTETHS